MRKILFFFILVTAIALISGRKQPAQNEMAEKYTKQATLKDFKDVSKLDISESKGVSEPLSSKKASEGSPTRSALLTGRNHKLNGTAHIKAQNIY